jgi:hypothetical protein
MTNVFGKSFKVILLFLIIVFVGATIFGQAKKGRFDPDGAFWINGGAPDGFLDFAGINLNSKKLRRLPAAGVELNTGKAFRFKQLTVSQERFTFTTMTVSTISYSFIGKFLRGGVFASANLDDETPVLEGVLTKYKAGTKVAEAKLKFVYFGGT